MSALGFEPRLGRLSTCSLCQRLGYADVMLWEGFEPSLAAP
jgi:hypothetical protein